MKLTQTIVDRLRTPGKYNDDHTRGLHLYVTEHSRTWKIHTTHKGTNRALKRTLGRADDYTLIEARRWADAILTANRRGERIEAPSTAPTLQEAVDRFLATRERRGKAERATANHRYRFNKYLGDWLDRPVNKITIEDIEARHEKLSHAPRLADQVFEGLRAVLNQKAVLRFLPSGNPVLGLEFYRVPPKGGRPMTNAADVAVWWRAVSGSCRNDIMRNFLRLQLVTGMHGGALAQTEVAWIDLPGRVIVYPAHVMKARRNWRLPLSNISTDLVDAALLLANARGSKWLFPSDTSKSGHITELHDRELKAQGYVMGHDLRRTFISFAMQTSIPNGLRLYLADHAVEGIQGLYADPVAFHDAAVKAANDVARALTREVLHFH